MSNQTGAAPARTVAADTPKASPIYVELTKPRITAMVLLTVALGAWVAGTASMTMGAILATLVGTGLACSGAGALNQYIERDTDQLMHRTRFRPLPARRVSSELVLALGTLLVVGGVGILATVNLTAAALNAATALSYLFVYTPLKRSSPSATLIGAIPGALPPVIGWAAARGQFDAGAWVLFGILFLWQIPHFLAIGRLYREDYANAGMPMLVVVDEDGDLTGRQMILYAATLVPVTLMLVPLGLAGPLYAAAAVVLGAVYLLYSARAWRRNDVASARQLLLCSVMYLPALLLALLADGLAG